MKIGIIGPALSGKSTLFGLLTGAASAAGRGGVPQAAARVPDHRVDRLAEVFRPRKTTYASIEFADFAAFGKGGEISGETAARLKTCDALTVVIRAFSDPSVPWPAEPVRPDASFTHFLSEMILSDLYQVEKLLSRDKDKRRTREEAELLHSCQAILEETRPISSGVWTAEQQLILRNFSFLSSRPVLVAVNLDEQQLLAVDYDGREELSQSCACAGYVFMEFCGSLESEISRMEKGEQEEYLAEYNLSESGIARLANGAYTLLELISFFTVGEDEVRAWTVKTGTPARKAAGKIHSDIERGFIRAEVIGFTEFFALGASLKTAREQGKLRLEGKEYPVSDGDIINFRFNV